MSKSKPKKISILCTFNVFTSLHSMIIYMKWGKTGLLLLAKRYSLLYDSVFWNKEDSFIHVLECLEIVFFSLHNFKLKSISQCRQAPTRNLRLHHKLK
jgi:hypothetical protein